MAVRGAEAIRLDALQRSHQQLDRAEQLALMGSFDWDPLSDQLQWSDEHFRLWGYAPHGQAATYDLFIQGVHPLDRQRL